MKTQIIALLMSVCFTACGSPSGPDSGTGGGLFGTGGGFGSGGGSGGGGSGGGSGGGATGGGTGGGATGGGTGGGAASGLSVAECNADMDKLASVGCADASNWTMAKTAICAKIPNASSALCADALTRARACQTQFVGATFGCVLGSTDSSDPCAVDVLLGVYCVAAMNNSSCAAAACQYSTDCPTNFGCNSKTGKCFNSSAYCVGVPCTFGVDCPTGETCNSALNQCVRN
jgi:hypothetical protein